MAITVHTMEYAGDGFPDFSLELRNYAPADYAEYKRVYEDCFFDMRTALGLFPVCCCDNQEVLSQKQKDIFILESAGKLVGSVAIYGNEVDDLIVAKPFQRKGYGQMLLRFAVSNMRRSNVSPIVLHVTDWNQGAIQMYRKNGFRIVKTEAV